MRISAIKSFDLTLDHVASDKSISHRFAIFSMLSKNQSKASNYLLAQDTINTLEIIKKLGAKVELKDDFVSIEAPEKILSPNEVLDCGNSGTAMRLMLGFLSSVEGFFVLSGDKYLNNRPMKRVSKPLSDIGAKIYGRDLANLAPLCIEGNKNLKAFSYESKISSAQVKTALILAGLRANSKSFFKEPSLSRNHSENMLLAMDAPISVSSDSLSIEINPLKKPLKALDISIPNDPSSVFYFVLAAIILPNSSICVKNVLLNKTRIEAYKVLERMGANIEYKFYKNDFESVGEIRAKSSKLKAIELSENISWLIDEAPALAIAFCVADGISVLRNAKELRVKESDRIKAMVENLLKCGIEAKELEDGFEIRGSKPKFASINSYADHRIAMSFAILGLLCGMQIDDSQCINTSFPNFKDILKKIGAVLGN